VKYNPYHYQTYSADRIEGTPYCGPWLDMGLGKTVATLTAIDQLIKAGKVKKVLVIAPKRVAESVWKQEGAKWDHVRHLRFSIVAGRGEKKRKEALAAKADIYVIGRDNTALPERHRQIACLTFGLKCICLTAANDWAQP